MITVYDTHAHFETQDDVEAILARARLAGVTHVLAVGGSDELNQNALRSPGSVALGFDRDQITMRKDCEEVLPKLLAEHAKQVVAVGEIGLDAHYTPETLSEQEKLFAFQLALADTLHLPVVIHTREADDATLGVLDEVTWHANDCERGVIHSFTGSKAFAGKLLDRGFMISFSGIATFKRAEEIREVVRYVPQDRLLVETDSPYLAPEPVRGKRCEPAFVVHTLKRLAQVRNVDAEVLATCTTANAFKLFGEK